jgi:hypothetical protein
MVAGVLAFVGTLLMGAAIYNERRMQRHRQPGVTYAQVTFRRDGGWRRTDLFTDEGLKYQRRASGFGVPAAILWAAAIVAYWFIR